MAHRKKKNSTAINPAAKYKVGVQGGTTFFPWALLLFLIGVMLLFFPESTVAVLDSAAGSALNSVLLTIGVIITASLVNALVVADLAAIASKGDRDITESTRLLAAVLARSGIGALWGSLLGVALAVLNGEVQILSVVSDLATLGGIGRLALSVVNCEVLWWHSVKKIWRVGQIQFIVAVGLVALMIFISLYAYLPIVWARR